MLRGLSEWVVDDLFIPVGCRQAISAAVEDWKARFIRGRVDVT